MTDVEQLSLLLQKAEIYGTLVVAELMDADVLVDGFDFGTHPQPENGAGSALIDIEFPALYSTRAFGDDTIGAMLQWDSESGWHLYIERPDEDIFRWMGAGLTPPPARVQAFLTSAQLSPDSVGSSERPYYPAGEADLADRLGGFEDELRARMERDLACPQDSEVAGLFFLFQAAQQRRLAVADLRADNDTRLIPLRAGELRTVVRLLQTAYSGHTDLHALVNALAEDLGNRYAGARDAAVGELLALADKYASAYETATEVSD
ncbi:DUF6292 family protein [Streptomyces sp. NRRL B-24484]|uniref:DUF6292 family protein n=1 Tax=Streptomyces sp. NRRL B-24484 TaxID=1463833 RepID=UPI0004BE7EB2|nr:DUF6292 family protein [Streptomyces sp. NRRL B-24484]